MFNVNKPTADPVFDFKALRLLMGIIALSLPYVVIWIAKDALSSISASYYTDARDTFIGMLFVVSAFLWAYNGHSYLQAISSKVASLAAVLVALFPTSCDGCGTSMTSVIHFCAAALLFSILAYFCLGPFRQHTKKQHGTKGRRAVVYLTCGWVMILAMVTGAAGYVFLSDSTLSEIRLTYWVELVSLNAFGIAWITAGKVIPGLVDKDEALFSFGRK